MSIVVDLILLLIVVISTYQGYKQGLIRCLAGIASIIIAITGTLVLLTPVTTFVNTNYVAPYVADKIVQTLDIDLVEASDKEFDSMITKKADDLKTIASKFGVQDDDIDTLLNNTQNSKSTKTEVVQTLTEAITFKMSKGITFVILFILLSVTCSIIVVIINKIFRMPLLRGANKILGLIFGGARGILIVLIISFVIVNLLPKIAAIPNANLPLHLFTNSKIAEYVSTINILI